MRQLPEPTFIQQWRSCFTSGQYQAFFWAAATRKGLSTGAKREIFGAIHMSMHANADHEVHVKRRLERFQKEMSEKSQKISILKQTCKDLQNKNERLRQGQMMLEAKVLSLAKKRDALNGSLETLKSQSRIVDLETENQQLQTALLKKTEHYKAIERELISLEKRFATLSKDLKSQKQANLQLKTEAQEAIRLSINASHCDPDCPAFDLCRKRILIVGGIERMEQLYRKLIEGRGGTFDYHDGCMNGGIKQLENSLKRADIVLCPVNCNSHAACSFVKNFGKKHSKPVYMMANFSLSAISKTLGKTALTN